MIRVKNLSRDFNNGTETVKAVKNISFSIEKGEIFGILGQNGAGKTTIIKMMCTLLLPTSGSCKINNFDVSNQAKKIRNDINFIFGGEMGVYRRLTAYENLKYFSYLYNIDRKNIDNYITELLNLVGLWEDRNKKVETFSKGMIQKLQIARGLINKPKIIFLDEPTIGLDALAARKLRKILKKLRTEGTTIVLTTHYLLEAEELCDHLIIINNGCLVTSGTPTDIIMEASKKSIEIKNLEDAYLFFINGDES